MEMYFRLRQLDGDAWHRAYREVSKLYDLQGYTWHYVEIYADFAHILFDIHGHIVTAGE